jgi:hypothetical protein
MNYNGNKNGYLNKNIMTPLNELQEVCMLDNSPNIYMTASDTTTSKPTASASRFPKNENIKSILIIMIMKSYFS